MDFFKEFFRRLKSIKFLGASLELYEAQEDKQSSHKKFSDNKIEKNSTEEMKQAIGYKLSQMATNQTYDTLPTKAFDEFVEYLKELYFLTRNENDEHIEISKNKMLRTLQNEKILEEKIYNLFRKARKSANLINENGNNVSLNQMDIKAIYDLRDKVKKALNKAKAG